MDDNKVASNDYETESTQSYSSSVKRERYDNLEDYYDGRRILKRSKPLSISQIRKTQEDETCCCACALF